MNIPSIPAQPASFPHREGVVRYRHTIWFLMAFYALAIASGVRSIHIEQPSALDSLLPIAFALALGWWATTDAAQRHRPIPLLSRDWFFILAGFIVPGYVIWSRRWRGLFYLLLCTVSWYGLVALIMIIG
jgi:hypothetical protein